MTKSPYHVSATHRILPLCTAREPQPTQSSLAGSMRYGTSSYRSAFPQTPPLSFSFHGAPEYVVAVLGVLAHGSHFIPVAETEPKGRSAQIARRVHAVAHVGVSDSG